MGHLMDREATVSPGRFLAEALEVARKDLCVEARTAETLRVTIPFGATALLLIPLAVGADIPLLRALGPGMYWTVVLLFGVLVTLRQSATDTPAQRDLLALLGIDPAACLVGRAAASALLLLGFQAMLGPVALVLYDPQPIGWAWLALLAPLVAVGLALLGTLAGALTERLPGRSSLAPAIVAPLSLPLLVGATQALEGARYGRSPLAWVLLLAAIDLVLLVVGVLGAGPLEEAPG